MERIFGFQPAGDRNASNLRFGPAGNQNRGGKPFFRSLKGRKRQLGPSLAEIGGTAAEMGFQAEKVGLSTVGAENHMVLWKDTALRLVRHLQVLMGPHILT